MNRVLALALVLAGALVSSGGTRAGSAEPAITYIESAKVAAAFAEGKPLLEVPEYKVHASRREKPGVAEVHVRDTDIIYVLDGTATMVTGGTVVDGKTTSPEEIRGASIQGGETRKLLKGDVLVVPNGTPHWFKEVQAPFLYYVVKVTSAEPAMTGEARR
jgi:glc operon protein GlcG